jgi:DNA-binding transcriptional regulator YiaG
MAYKDADITPEELRIGLIRLNMTNVEFARVMRVSPISISSWCRGRTPIPYYAEYFLKNMLKEKERGDVDAACAANG